MKFRDYEKSISISTFIEDRHDPHTFHGYVNQTGNQMARRASGLFLTCTPSGSRLKVFIYYILDYAECMLFQLINKIRSFVRTRLIDKILANKM